MEVGVLPIFLICIAFLAYNPSYAHPPPEQLAADRVVAFVRSRALVPAGVIIHERTVRTGRDGTIHVSLLLTRVGQHGQRLPMARECFDVLASGVIVNLYTTVT